VQDAFTRRSASPHRGEDNLQGAVATDRQVSEGSMWSCYTSARAGELSCSHERTSAVLSLVRFSFRSHSKSLFCWPLHSASAFCIHNQPLSASLHSIAAVQHSSAPRPLFGCVVEHRIATAPAAFSTPTDLAASLRPVQAKRASPSLASHPFTIHLAPIPSTPGCAFFDE
jgi:hypothetical protein